MGVTHTPFGTGRQNPRVTLVPLKSVTAPCPLHFKNCVLSVVGSNPAADSAFSFQQLSDKANIVGGSPQIASAAVLGSSHGGGFGIPFAKRQREDAFDDSATKKGKIDMNSDSDLLKDEAGSAQADFNKGSCHQCKSRRAIGDLIFCTNIVDKKNKHCRKKYCEGCLKKFYKEDVSDPSARTSWSCPSCRKMCCCAACRRRRDPKEVPAQGTPHQLPSDQAMMSSIGGQMMQPNFSPFESSGLFSSLMREPSGGTPISYMANNMGAFQPQLPQDHPLFSQPSTSAGVPQSSSFAMLYAVAQMPHVRDQIKQILHRADLTDEQKVESIAALLRRAVVGDENAESNAEQATDPEATCDETTNEFGNEEA